MSPSVTDGHSKPVKVLTQRDPRSVVVEKYGMPQPPAKRARTRSAAMTARTRMMQNRAILTALRTFG